MIATCDLQFDHLCGGGDTSHIILYITFFFRLCLILNSDVKKTI